MTALESLTGKLQRTRLYNLSGSTYIFAEIKAFSAGLQLIYDELEHIGKEMFPATAENEGLEMYESLISVCNTDTSLAGRRKSILAALSVGCRDYNRSGFEKLPDIFNIHGEFTEPEDSTIQFRHTVQIDPQLKNLIAAQMAEFMPCGVDFTFV